MKIREVAARRGMRLLKELNGLLPKVPNRGVMIAQWITRQSSNYSLVLEFVVLLAVVTIILGSSWVFCALDNACFQANGGMF